PDLCVFDLDPSRDDPKELRAAALAVRALLDELGLPSWLKTSGSKGFHLVVPLDGEAAFDSVYEFTGAVGAVLVRRNPELLTQEFSKADRGGRILVDTGRNGFGATFAAAYAVRPKPGAPVSAPCTWQELESGNVVPRTFTLRTMAARIADVGDLWADVHEHGRSLRAPLKQVRALLTDEEWSEAEAAKRRRPKARKSRNRA
ncbi:MAG TPA: DNA primase small subunit domain-containing protein, partial [Polyangiaceae bacterium]